MNFVANFWASRKKCNIVFRKFIDFGPGSHPLAISQHSAANSVGLKRFVIRDLSRMLTKLIHTYSYHCIPSKQLEKYIITWCCTPLVCFPWAPAWLPPFRARFVTSRRRNKCFLCWIKIIGKVLNLQSWKWEMFLPEHCIGSIFHGRGLYSSLLGENPFFFFLKSTRC